MNKIIRFISILSCIFLGVICICIPLMTDEQETKEEKRKRDININRNIQAFYESDDNVKGSAIEGISGSNNPLWTNPNKSPSDIGGNIEVVYGKISEQERWYLEDIVELVNLANKTYGRDFEVGLYVGVALSESISHSIKIGGVNMPLFIKGIKTLDNYKKGDLMKAPGVDTKGSYYGHFQLTSDALNMAMSKSGVGKFDVKNQFFAFTNVYASKMSSYDSIDWLTPQEKYVAASMEFNLFEYHPNKKALKGILPDVLKLFLEPSISNTIIREDVGESKEGLAKRLMLFEEAYLSKYKDKFKMLVTLDDSNSINNGIVKKHSKIDIKSHSEFPPKTQNLLSAHPRLIFHPIGDESTYILSFYHGVLRHGLNTAKIPYYTQLIKVMISNPEGTDSVKPRVADTQSSIYYNEYENIRNNKTNNTSDLALDTYKTVNKDVMEDLLRTSKKENNLITGSIGEIGWKDGFPLYKQSLNQETARAKMTFNGKETTLADAGCSIYSLASMLHQSGFGTTPIPNSEHTGLNSQGLLDPRELAKVVDAPIIPSKIEKLGYSVEQLPMNTKEDIYKLMNEVQKGKAYMVNTRISQPIRALTAEGKEVSRRFTNSGHFVIVSNVVEIDGKLYFEVIDSISSPTEELDSNRLFYDLDDAISKEAIGRSSLGGIVPAFRVTGLLKPNQENLTEEINKMILSDNEIRVKDKVVEIKEQSGIYNIIVMIDNVNYVKFKSDTKPDISTGIYNNAKIFVNDTHNFTLGQYIGGEYKDFVYDVNNFQISS